MEIYSRDPFDDERKETFRNRIAIGFQSVKESWRHAPAVYTTDTLTICNHPVMEAWEEPYMRKLAHVAARQGGRVLEVGFGMGISAAFVQEYPLEEHVIIEANEEVYQRACSFAQQAVQKVTVIKGFWEDVVPTLVAESFDGILFDTYPLSSEEIHTNHFPFIPYAHRLLKQGGVLTYYSDEISGYASRHLKVLQDAGFHDIQAVICSVTPPAGCQYWTSNTILAPIITKTEVVPAVKNFGLHLMLDCYGIERARLADVTRLYDALIALPQEIDMNRIGFPHIAQFKDTDIDGISGIQMIVESHISVHTYEKKGFLTADIYSCKTFDTDRVVEFFREWYGCSDIDTHVVERGTKFPVNDIY